ncbi:MAG: hypothetical protein QM778_05655 [Myxococcales bacterium]
MTSTPRCIPVSTRFCDGRDNDCDTRVDETTNKPLCDPGLSCIGQRCTAPDCTPDGNECPADQRCDPMTLHCVALGCTPGSCPSPQYCDQTSGQCRTTRRPNGDPCVADGDCVSGSCADRVALRLKAEASRLCVQACCADSDCATGERCHVSGSGARSCLPSALTPRPSNAPAPCTADDQCPRQTCTLVSDQTLSSPAEPERHDLVASSCEAVSFGFSLGDACNSDSVCASKACVPSPGLFPPNVCSRPCGTSADCKDLEMAADGLFASRPRSYCRFVTKGPGQDYLPICVLPQNTMGAGGFGSRCANGSNCLEGACVGAAGETPGMCSIACCRDSDCPGLTTGPTKCRPVAFGEHFEMRCMP